MTHAVGAVIEALSSLRLHRHDEVAAGAGAEVGPPAWVPAAGVPWFVTLFGRDSLVVSLQTLALSWRFAQGALEALGTFQADSYDDDRDMQPGKVVHEIRHGELAHFRLIPHTPYYGTHDATSLFVWAAASAWRWHGDRQLLDRTRPHVERALAWIDTDGDIDGDGLQEYRTRAASGGYRNQGWKDAGDAVVTADGSQPPLPIALCELQGYVVAAKRAWADVLADAYGEHDAATRLRGEAARLADLIEERFWWEEERTYLFGLDGDKRPIRAVASNPGHLLWASAIEPGRARQVADRMLAEDMWSGWGVRTLSARNPAYDPFSYQRGSVWPHDNAAFAAGCWSYGLKGHAAQVARAVLDTAIELEGHLPELIAGIARDRPGFPVPYADANVPQAWASGALVQMLTAMLGPVPDASRRALVLRPALPHWLSEITVSNLGVGASRVDVTVRRDRAGVHAVEATTVSGDAVDVEHDAT